MGFTNHTQSSCICCGGGLTPSLWPVIASTSPGPCFSAETAAGHGVLQVETVTGFGLGLLVSAARRFGSPLGGSEPSRVPTRFRAWGLSKDSGCDCNGHGCHGAAAQVSLQAAPRAGSETLPAAFNTLDSWPTGWRYGAPRAKPQVAAALGASSRFGRIRAANEEGAAHEAP